MVKQWLESIEELGEEFVPIDYFIPSVEDEGDEKKTRTVDCEALEC